MRRLFDVTDTGRQDGGVGAAQRDNLERLLELEKTGNEATNVTPDAGRG